MSHELMCLKAIGAMCARIASDGSGFPVRSRPARCAYSFQVLEATAALVRRVNAPEITVSFSRRWPRCVRI